MSEQECGSCDHQGKVTREKAECLVDSKIYERPHHCDDFKEYIQGKNEERRLKESLEVKRTKEAKAAEKRMRDFEEKMAQKQRDFEKTLQDENRKSQTRLVILAGLIALLTSLIMNLIS
jgi:hypothetical protein